MRIAFRRWTRRTTASAAAASALSRLARRCYSRAAREGLLRWRRAATQARTEGLQDRLTEAKALAARGTGNARRTAAVVLLGAFRRSRRQSLRWGFGMLEERRLDKERKVKCIRWLVGWFVDCSVGWSVWGVCCGVDLEAFMCLGTLPTFVTLSLSLCRRVWARHRNMSAFCSHTFVVVVGSLRGTANRRGGWNGGRHVKDEFWWMHSVKL